ncbi:hypothetical protein PG991_001118 [Apiospora marii]|uniref:SNF2 N-terminal domain-containing protein n=1 Tax=Apiospora marii TaxID=335849 RepID=A0ABR1STW7_9PEZI
MSNQAGAARPRGPQQNQNGAQAQQLQNLLLDQVNQIKNRVDRIPGIEQRLHFARRSCANVLIRVAQDNGGENFYQEFLGQILNGDYTQPGNLDWSLVKQWVIRHINLSVGDSDRVTQQEEDATDLFIVVNERGQDLQATLVNKILFISGLINWEKGATVLPEVGGLPYVRFENTKLVQGHRRPVLPGAPAPNPNPNPANPEANGGDEGDRGGDENENEDEDEDEDEDGGDRDPEDEGTPDDISRGAVDNDLVLEDVIRKGDDPLLDKPAHWDEVTAFFTHEGAGRYQFILPGLNFPIEGYQAAAVLWLLLRIPDASVAGPMLSDDMGLGKTFTIIVTILVHASLQKSMAEVKADWTRQSNQARAAREESPSQPQFRPEPKHNPPDAPQGQRCPSQVSNKYYLQCPCVAGSAARRIVDNMADLPNIIVTPSAGATLWISEWDKFINPLAGMTLYVGVNGYRGDKMDLKQFRMDMERAAGPPEVPRVVQEGHATLPRPRDILVQRSRAFHEGSTNVLIVTREGCNRLKIPKDGNDRANRYAFVKIPERPAGVPDAGQGRQTRQSRQTRQAAGLFVQPTWDEEAGVPVTGCGIFAMDELHQYKGTIGKPTMPFQLLHLFKHQYRPTLAIGVSGNLLGVGPEAWVNLVAHTQGCIARHRLNADLGRLQDYHEYLALMSEWNYIQTHIQAMKEEEYVSEASRETYIGYRDNIARDFRKGIGKMVIRRTKADSFKGVKILDIAEPVTTPMKLAIPGGATLNALRANFNQIGQWMQTDYRAQVQDWAKNGKRGAKPKLEKSQDGLPKKGSQAHKDALNVSVRSVTFPSLANLAAARGTRELAKHYSGKELGALATTFTLATLDPERNTRSIRRALNSSPFTKHASTLRQSSPKYQALRDLVRTQLINTREDNIRGDQPDIGPADGSFVRHMVVFAEAPVTAYLTALLLQEQFIEDVDVILIHVSLKDRAPPEGSQRPWHCREIAFRNFQANCAKTDKNKILVGTYDLISTMHNFYRASSAVMLDVATVVERDQARDRIYRRGQTVAAQITEMWYGNHVYEHSRKVRNEGIDLMSEINWDDYGMPAPQPVLESDSELYD